MTKTPGSVDEACLPEDSGPESVDSGLSDSVRTGQTRRRAGRFVAYATVAIAGLAYLFGGEEGEIRQYGDLGYVNREGFNWRRISHNTDEHCIGTPAGTIEILDKKDGRVIARYDAHGADSYLIHKPNECLTGNVISFTTDRLQLTGQIRK
ncbi:MAG: hypothetical protein ABH879_03060 [archaeon]